MQFSSISKYTKIELHWNRRFPLLLPTWIAMLLSAALVMGLERSIQAQETADDPRQETAGGWILLGRPSGGDVMRVAVDPKNHQTLYVGTATGIYRSDDGGETWSAPLNAERGADREILIHPVNSDYLYVDGTYASSDGGQSWNVVYDWWIVDRANPGTLWRRGVEKSIDNGLTWQPASTGLPDLCLNHAYVLAVDAVSGSTVYASVPTSVTDSIPAEYAIYRTDNGGGNWLPASGTFTQPVSSAVVHPNDPAVLYASRQGGWYRSRDGGENWQHIGITQTWASLMIHPQNPQVIYARISSDLYRSSDEGSIWRSIWREQGFTAPINGVRLHPTDPDALYVSSHNNLYSSTDAGENWHEQIGVKEFQSLSLNDFDTGTTNPLLIYLGVINANRSPSVGDSGTGCPPHNQQKRSRAEESFSAYLETGLLRIQSWDQNSQIASSDVTGNGIYRSSDAGETWQDVSTNLFAQNIIDISTHPLTSAELYASIGRNVTLESKDGGATWEHSSLPGVPIYSPQYQDDRTAYVLTSNRRRQGSGTQIWYGGLYRQVPEDEEWLHISANIPPNAYGAVSAVDLAIDPERSETLYLTANEHIYKSVDRGTSWFTASQTIDGSVFFLALAPSHPETLYAAAGSGIWSVRELFRSANGGSSWTRMSDLLDYANIIWSDALVVDPSTPLILYAGTDRGLYKSVDGAGSWFQPTQHFSRSVISQVIIDPVTPSRLFVLVEREGIFQSLDGGVTWQVFSAGIEDAGIQKMRLVPSGDIPYHYDLVATTSHSGVWLYPNAVSAPVLQVNPSALNFYSRVDSANPTAQSFQITNGGSGRLNWRAQANVSWIGLNRTSGTAPSTIQVGVNVADLTVGVHTGLITISPEDAANSPQQIPVTLKINNRITSPSLLLLTDLDALYAEFLDTGYVPGQDGNTNGQDDWYDLLQRVDGYLADHNGVMIDLAQEIRTDKGYAANYADLSYGSTTAERIHMGELVDDLIYRLTLQRLSWREDFSLYLPLIGRGDAVSRSGPVETGSGDWQPDPATNQGRMGDYANVTQIVILGDDQVVPFYRILDPTDLHAVGGSKERDYPREVGGAQNNPALLDSGQGYILSDLPYAARGRHRIERDSTLRPNLSIGRIFAATPDILRRAIDAYEQPIVISPENGQATIFTHKDTQRDINFPAAVRRSTWPVIEAWFPPEQRQLYDGSERSGWQVQTVVNALAESDLISIWSHANHRQIQVVSDGYLGSLQFNHLLQDHVDGRGRIFIGVGCNLGYSVANYPDGAPSEHYTHALMNQFMARGITTLAPSGYATLQLSVPNPNLNELLASLFVRHLLTNERVTTVGEIWQYALPDFLKYDPYGIHQTNNPSSNAYHRKVVYGNVLYGLPTQPIVRQQMGLRQLRTESVELPGQISQPRRETAQRQRLAIDVPEFIVEQLAAGSLFRVPNGGSQIAPDFGPSLPVVARTLILPRNAGNVQVTQLGGGKAQLYPGIVRLPNTGIATTNGEILQGSFSLPDTYPEQIFWYTVSEQEDGLRLDLLVVPLEYSPSYRQMTIYTHLEFEVTYLLHASTGPFFETIQVAHPEVSRGTPLEVELTVAAPERKQVKLWWQAQGTDGLPIALKQSPLTVADLLDVSFQIDTSAWPAGIFDVTIGLADERGILDTENISVKLKGARLHLAADTPLWIHAGDPETVLRLYVYDQDGTPLAGLAEALKVTVDQTPVTPTVTEVARGAYNVTLMTQDWALGNHVIALAVRGHSITSQPATTSINVVSGE